MTNRKNTMGDIREALLALLCQEGHAPMDAHDPRDGSCLSCPWPLHEMPPEDIADAILAAGWAPRGEGVTVEWGVGYGNQCVATESLEEAEEWIADEDAWAPGEERWLIMRQVGPWTRAARIARGERDREHDEETDDDR